MVKHSSRTHPTLERSPKKNWVEGVGGLPDFIERVAKHIFYDSPGYTISRAIAAAVSQVKKWAAKGNAKAIRAVAQWQSKKARAKLDNASDVEFAIHLAKQIEEEINLAEKLGTKSDGVTSTSKLEAAKRAYKRKKKKMSPAERKKTEARLKSSQQRLGQKVGLSSDSEYQSTTDSSGTQDNPVDLALANTRKFDESKHNRSFGGRFGSKGGAKSVGASNNSATKQEPQSFRTLVQKLQDGQSVTLPNSKVKIKKIPGGYQVWDGKHNVAVKTFDSAISRAQAFSRGGKGGNSSNAAK